MATDEKRKPSRRRAALLLPLLLVTLLGGCAARRAVPSAPEVQVPDAWQSTVGGGLAVPDAGAAELTSWWASLGDPQLTLLVERAAAANLDRQRAESRVREARAQHRGAASGLWPSLDLGGSTSHGGSSGGDAVSTSWSSYAAQLDAGWEVDLFAGVRRTVEAAEADLAAQEEALRDVLVTLCAEVALNYVELRSGQERLAEAEAQLQIQEETLRLVAAKNLAGLVDDLALEEARSSAASTRAGLPARRTAIEESMNRLAVLLGEPPGALHADLAEARPIPEPTRELAVGLPAEALRRRPDVRRAERQLEAETARLGAAVADLYPQLTLGGSIGLEALSAGDLLSAATRSWSIGPRLTWHLFDAGAVRANIEARSEGREQAYLDSQSAILGALEEVENALVAYDGELRRREALGEALRAAESAAELAGQKYEAGLADFLEVLTAQRSRLSLADELGQSRGAVVSDLIRIYKALGGGWTIPTGGQGEEGR